MKASIELAPPLTESAPAERLQGPDHSDPWRDAAPSAPAATPHSPAGDGAPDWRIWLGLGITIGWLLLGSSYIGSSIGWSAIGDQPAEVIGNFLEGAFAPLAFLWLVIGYFLQQKELSQNTEALRQQFREIERTAEQAVKQTETISAQERHARQQIFLQVHELVRRQLGAIAGMLWISPQGPGEDGSTVSNEEQAELWTQLNQGDPDVFCRRILNLHFVTDRFEDRLAFFYGTEIRARHTNNMIFTLGRLMDRAEAADSDGTLVDAINGSVFGFVYQLAVQYRRHASADLADVQKTGREIRLGGFLDEENPTLPNPRPAASVDS